jgi:hypothetical protein
VVWHYKAIPLHASYKKIHRANSKLVNLEASINSYLGSNTHSVKTQIEGDRAYVIARLEKDIPEDLASEVVELAGHLRSALDKMVVALVRRNGLGTSGIGFPFSGMNNGKPEPFPSDRMEKGIKKKLTPEQWARIAFYEPYPGGKGTLWAVNEIANTDKHREDLVYVEPKLASAVWGMPQAGFAGQTINVNLPQDQSIVQAQERVRVLMSYVARRPDPNINTCISTRIVFANVPAVQGKDVMVTLKQECLLISAILDDFKARFFI